MDRRFFDVIKAPVLTEKSYKITQLENKYTFEVRKDASKCEIRKVFTLLFAVKVASVNIINKKKKKKKVGKYEGFKGAKKYAIIQLAPGEKLNIYNDQADSKTKKTTREKIEEKIFSINDKKESSKKPSKETKTLKPTKTKVKENSSLKKNPKKVLKSNSKGGDK